MHGAFDKEIVLTVPSQASHVDEEVAQPAPSNTPDAKPQRKVTIL